jgi:hypothetical protein
MFGQSTNGIDWTYSITKSGWGSGNNILFIAYNGSQYIAGGSGTERIIYSSDGVTWNSSNGLTGSEIPMCSAWNGTRWVVGTYDGYIHHSTDGITWTKIGTQVTTGYFKNIVWNGTIFVACMAGSKRIAYSTDGLTWTAINSPFSEICSGVAWDGSLWVAVGKGTNESAYSSDGINWTGGGNIFTGAYGACAIVWEGTKFVALEWFGARISESTDGDNWSAAVTIPTYNHYPLSFVVADSIPTRVLGVEGEYEPAGGETSHTFS